MYYMKKLFLYFILAALSITAHATGTRTVVADQIQSADLSKTYTLPSATDTVVGRASTDTLTNKTLTSPSLTTPAVDVPLFTQQSTPANPAASKNKLYFKSGDHLYMLNSGGTETQVDGGGSSSFPPTYTNHQSITATGNGTFTVPGGVHVMGVHVRGGGASGGNGTSAQPDPGGGGGGCTPKYTKNYIVEPGQVIKYRVGVGGTAPTSDGANGNNGENSFFGDLVSLGGSAGVGAHNTGGAVKGNAGGVGFGSTGQNFDPTAQTFATLAASFGIFDGGAYAGSSGSTAAAGGGAGASEDGQAGVANQGGRGGVGLTTDLTGSSACTCGGGGGGNVSTAGGTASCGASAGTIGGNIPANPTANSGSGGGGCGRGPANGCTHSGPGADGGIDLAW